MEQRIGVRPVVAMIHRADLVAALAGLLPDGLVRCGFECVGAERRGDRVSVRFANGHTDEADAVIGADGIGSAVRSALFGAQPPRYAGYTCWRGISPRPASIAAGYVGEWWGRGKRFGITTIPGDRVYWFAVHNAARGQRATDEHAAVADLLRSWAEPVGELIATTPPERLIRGDILDRPPMKSWSVGPIGLIGDAAHPTTPNLGQGGCMAIEDGVALARALMANPGDAPRALQAFAAERSRRTAAITRESWRIGKVAQWEGRLACGIRDRLLGLVLPIIGSRSLPKHASFDSGLLPERS